VEVKYKAKETKPPFNADRIHADIDSVMDPMGRYLYFIIKDARQTDSKVIELQ
jgi:hypothetical protein